MELAGSLELGGRMDEKRDLFGYIEGINFPFNTENKAHMGTVRQAYLRRSHP